MKIAWEGVPVMAWAREHQREAIELIRAMVEIESPSDHDVSLERFRDWFAGASLCSRVTVEPGGHLLCEFESGGGAGLGHILALGHYDTVWPVGTLAAMPFREHEGRLWGPGVLDMKAGIAFFLMALRALRELDVPLVRRVRLLLNADEETGSHSSRTLTEAQAQGASVVLVLEPGTGLTGKLKTARKGVGDYRIDVAGRASHAGVDFNAGASAILELARQLLTVEAFTDSARGITVNPGVIRGGTRSNVIAAEAMAQVDVRIARPEDAEELERRFHALRAVDQGCVLTVTGGLNRPPMQRTEAIAALFASARAIAAGIGVDLEESSTGGGSDGNFTAALGIPTLDGLGAVGEGAHAANESILTDRIADRIALLAMLTAEISVG